MKSVEHGWTALLYRLRRDGWTSSGTAIDPLKQLLAPFRKSVEELRALVSSAAGSSSGGGSLTGSGEPRSSGGGIPVSDPEPDPADDEAVACLARLGRKVLGGKG